MRFTYYLLFTAEIRALRWTSEEVEGLNEGMRVRSNLVLWNSLYPTIKTSQLCNFHAKFITQQHTIYLKLKKWVLNCSSGTLLLTVAVRKSFLLP